MNENPQVSLLRKWIIAIRPFALPASTMPVIFGTVLAVVIGEVPLNFTRFVIGLLAMVILHSGANMLNDVIDFKMKIDTFPSPVSGAIVRGLLSARSVLIAAVTFLVIGTLLGLYLAWFIGPILLIVGMIGVVIGVFYTVGPIALKYHALGDLAVFLNFGILGSLGAWLVQTKEFSWLPIIWAIPIGLLVSGILHANNWRDTPTDTSTGIQTMASIMGDKKSLIYFGMLIFGPFILLLGFMFIPRIWVTKLPAMPFTFFITIFALPLALKLWQRAIMRTNPRHPLDFLALDGATAQMNLLFGLLCTGALLLHHFAERLL